MPIFLEVIPYYDAIPNLPTTTKPTTASENQTSLGSEKRPITPSPSQTKRPSILSDASPPGLEVTATLATVTSTSKSSVTGIDKRETERPTNPQPPHDYQQRITPETHKQGLEVFGLFPFVTTPSIPINEDIGPTPGPNIPDLDAGITNDSLDNEENIDLQQSNENDAPPDLIVGNIDTEDTISCCGDKEEPVDEGVTLNNTEDDENNQHNIESFLEIEEENYLINGESEKGS